MRTIGENQVGPQSTYSLRTSTTNSTSDKIFSKTQEISVGLKVGLLTS